MKKSPPVRFLPFCLFLASCFGFAAAAPYGPDGLRAKWTQPNGTALELRVYGDENYGRTETPAGYTVVFNDANLTYYYANLAADGSALIPSNVRADLPPPAGQPKHLDLAKAKIHEISRANRIKYADPARPWQRRVEANAKLRAGAESGVLPADAAEAKIQAAPLVGKKVGLTILVQFPDDDATNQNDPIDFPSNREKMIRFCNGEGYNEDGNTGSIRDYYFDQSDGKLTYTQDVSPIVTVPKARNFYNFSDYPTNNKLRNDASRVLITDAIEVLRNSGFDFSQLTLDGNDRVLATNVFFAGDNSGVFARGLWPQQWQLENPINVGSPGSPINIFRFQITDNPDASPTIGTFCHENGHLLCGFPDLYDYGYESEGVGFHCLMGAGNYNNNGKTPAPIDIYLKDQLGWADVTDLKAADYRTVSLPTTGNVGVRLRKPGNPGEYFIVENRGSGDIWASACPDQGVAIWHIDESVSGNNKENMTPARHYEVSLEQIDGNFDLENGFNLGDGNDLLDFADNFTDNTTPDAEWWDRTPSKIRVAVLTGPAATTDVRFGAIPPNSLTLTSPNGGEIIYPLSLFPITWDANILGNVRIDLLRGGNVVLGIAASTPDTGKFNWKVPEDLPAGANYRILISSITNPTPVSDQSDGTFQCSDASFPIDGTMPFGWYQPNDAKTGWRVTQDFTYEGRYSLGSINPGDGASSAIAYRSNFNGGIISFYVKVSSEEAFDLFRFEIDGKPQAIGNGGGGGSLSGNVAWKFCSIPLAPGEHTLRWTYKKDDSLGDLLDAAWIDALSLPATNGEIVVEQPFGNSLISGKNINRFKDTPLGFSSKPMVFKISNVGTGDLNGVEVKKFGTDAEDFILTEPEGNGIASGENMTFEVVFKPNARGSRKAMLRILSNDKDESTFTVTLEGMCTGLPAIAVYQPSNVAMKDGRDSRSFGSVAIDSPGVTKIFTIRNLGDGALTKLFITKTGSGKSSFKFDQPEITKLAPGESTNISITFKPDQVGVKTAGIRIESNDEISGPFDFEVNGRAIPPSAPSGSALAEGDGASALFSGGPAIATSSTVTSTEMVGGMKYQTLAVSPAGGIIEVSPNLQDWYSGSDHTTVLIDDGVTLKVRDNTPLVEGVKRYIRHKP